MTYNFDPDRWYEDQQRLLEMRRRDGALDARGFEEALRKLAERYEKMVSRLDGTYDLSRHGGEKGA